MAKKDPQSDNDNQLLFIIFLGAVSLLLAYFYNQAPTQNFSITQSGEGIEDSRRVNWHLRTTNDSIQNKKQKVHSENEQMLIQASRSKSDENPNKPDQSLDISGDQTLVNLTNEIGRGQRWAEEYSPHETIQREIKNEQEMQEYAQAYKAEYARQFIDNARRGGYKVILSEDLSRVISVTPLKTQSSGNLLPINSGGHGSR